MQDRIVNISEVRDSLEELSNEIALLDSLCGILLTLVEECFEPDSEAISDYTCILKRHASSVRERMRAIYENM